ncbi:FxLYD domain-containing protein [Saliphagus sp. GCM10025334]|uniref:FxLYD domain-containing protein n=1 Tax=Natronosalvus caseinilyticus TaxID=2953747 RepID=UPI0028A77BA4|nr:FxLYD domain-containing protein [Natronosalvus caseinilyticus]
MFRRKLLATGGTLLSLTIAGCASSDDGNGDREEGATDDGNGNGNGNGEDSGNGNGDDSSQESSDDDGSAEEEKQVEVLEHEWYNNGSYDAGVKGRLENVSGEELSYVGIEVFFLDEEGTQIGEGLDNTTDLAEGRVWEFDAGYLDDDPQRVDSYEIKPDVMNY